MLKRFGVMLYRLGLAGLTIWAIVRQLQSSSRLASFHASNFFSFFTIESNILACAVFIIGSGLIVFGAQRRWFEAIRGAATLYMVTTGLIYAALLSGNEVALQTTLPWVNTVLHQIMPVAVLLDWIVVRPSSSITQKQLLAWLGFPVAYVVYSLLRGSHVSWYPYPFLDPRPHGYLHVLIYSIGIAVTIIGLAYIIRMLGNRKHLRGSVL